MTEKTNQLAAQFMHINGFFLRYRMMTYAHKDINPHKGQGRVLAILKMQPEIVQKELGYLLDISKQALAELINKLEKKGYITRAKSEKDRRSFVIKLTEMGRKAIPQENDETDHQSIEEFFDCLNDEEQKNFINYMDRIIDTIEEKMNIDEDDYAVFFRERFFARHGHEGNMPEGFWGLNPHKFRCYGGNKNDK
jgi:DNA-binding MarR family transcriptional regulator